MPASAVNAKARYDATALMFAADKGHLEVVRLLVERGADVNATDTFYRFRAIDLALMNNHRHVAAFLLERGSRGAANALNAGIRAGDEPLVSAALASADLQPSALSSAVATAKRGGNAAIVQLVEKAAAARPAAAATPAVTVAAATLQSYAGTYRNEEMGLTAVVAAADNAVTICRRGSAAADVHADVRDRVRHGRRSGSDAELQRPRRDDRVARYRPGHAANSVAAGGERQRPRRPLLRRQPSPSRRPPIPSRFAESRRRGLRFEEPTLLALPTARAPLPNGISPPDETSAGKRPFPALPSRVQWCGAIACSSPPRSAPETRRSARGCTATSRRSNDLSTHTWRMYAVDRRSGKVLWQRDVYTGAPKVKRHTKSSQASSTPATDGKHVVAIFGTIGQLVAFDVDGKPLWTREIGVIDNGWFFDPTYQWGHSSSPIIYKSSVIVQADQQKGSYMAAFDLTSGKPLWRTERANEISTWGTPAIVSGPRGDELVTNGTKVRGYDPMTGKELWTLGPNSEITVGTPVVGKGIAYVTGGYPPVRPLYAVKAGGTGDISLQKGQTASDAIAWSNDREGTYIPTPVLYRDILYTLNSNGILIAYNAATGERLYRARVGGGGAFAASPSRRTASCTSPAKMATCLSPRRAPSTSSSASTR